MSRSYDMTATTAPAPMPIRLLPPLLVNQIAAGEVIERPANVVKELLENALDAGATRIAIETESGGRERIEISDDGRGIPAAELPLAVAAHATSKIAIPEDLASIETLGFRGEALASIASVSRLRIVSRTADAEDAASIEVEGNRVSPVRPASGPCGTTISVRNLFFNTPARRKFLKSDAAEAGRIGEMVATIAMAHPTVAFRLRQDGRTTLDLPGAATPRERVVAVLGKDAAAELIEAGAETTPQRAPAVDAAHGRAGGDHPRGEVATAHPDAWLRVWGVVGTPAMARPTGRHLRLFLNGRAIVDRSVAHAVREAYRGLIDPARHPTAALFLTVDPSEVDVNVHPAKSEVRFRNASAVFSMVHSTVKRALHAADLVPALELRGGEAADAGGMSVAGPLRGVAAGAGGASGSTVGFSIAEARAALAREIEWSEPPATGDPVPAAHMADGRPPAPVDAEALLPAAPQRVRVLQIHEKYLVVEDVDGMLVIDQHALHERVMFEKLRARFVGGSLESQRLLLPADVPADAARLEALDRLRPLLLRLGIDAEASGPATIAVHAFPSALLGRRVEPGSFLADLLDRAVGEGLPPSGEAALVEVLAMMACKAAIKAGDRLRPEELDELLRLREQVERSTACPHGRPTSLRVSLQDLNRQFGR